MERKRTGSSRDGRVALLTVMVVAAMFAATVGLANAAPTSTQVQLTGRLLVANGDTSAGRPTVLQTSLSTVSGVVPLRIPVSQRAQMVTLSGRQVRARGTRTHGAFDVASLASTSPTLSADPTAVKAASTRTLRVAVVLMHPPGSARADVTKAQAEARFFGGRSAKPTSVAEWFSEVSSAQVKVSGTVFGYYDSGLPANDCNLSHWLVAAASAARRDGYSSGAFTNLVVYTPAQRCPFAGIARVGSNGAYINGHLVQAEVEHELGHNLGLWNAGAYSCSPPTAKCLASVSDPADIMGNARGSDDYSAVHKYMLGWLPASEVRTATSGSQTITLTASDHPLVARSTQLIFVSRKDRAKYSIERRGLVGNKGALSGVWIRLVTPAGTDDTELARNGPLAVGQTFVDPVSHITIKTLSSTARTSAVQVCVGSCATGEPTTPTPPPTPPTPPTEPPPVQPVQPVNVGAASREVMWAGCRDVVGLSDAQLDEWHRRGVGGFVCQIQYLAGLGGTQGFSADPHAALTGAGYDLQRQIRDSGIVARAAARGIKIWMGFYLANYSNKVTPLEPWFDDSAWSTQLLPQLGDLAGAAHMLGFAGLAFDEELYSGATWSWDASSNTHSEAEVRAEVRARGAQMMHTIVAAFPGVDVIDYGTYFPEGWNDLVQQQVNGTANAEATSLQINLWDGLTSVAGYGPIRFMDATFYKATQLSGATWDNALTYDINRWMAYLSRNLTNWDYASSRIDISPFAWIDGDVQNEGSFTAPRPAAYVATQLAAFRRWGMGGAFAIYSYAPLGTFDYTPYIPAMQAAAVPGTVDDTPPGITISTTRRSGATITMTGTATDNMAIRDVRWQTSTGSGVAPMTWTVTNGSWNTNYVWHMDWTAAIPAPTGTTITITTQDTAGNTRDATAIAS